MTIRAIARYKRGMNVLAKILSSRVRAEIFRLLFGCTSPELHNREIVRRAGLSESAVRQELGKLTRLDLIVRRKDGNRIYYKANKSHPLYQDIKQMVLKTNGLVDILNSVLPKPEIHVAFVFGSLAKGTETATSDIDIMIIGEIGLRKLSRLLAGISEQLGRELNPHVMTVIEYKKRLKTNDHFVTHVLSGSKLFVVGTKDDFKAMVS